MTRTAARSLRPAWAEVDLQAITHNAQVLRAACAPAQLLGVVKANGYGHGAVAVAEAAVRGGATWLGVALVEEGIALRQAGIEAPILVLSEPAGPAMVDVVHFRLTPSIYTEWGVAAAADAVSAAGAPPLAVHIKVDTGMHRVGAPWREAAVLAGAVARCPQLVLGGVFTHLAVADEPDNAYTAGQLAEFNVALAALGPIPRYATPPTRPGRCCIRRLVSNWSDAASRSTAWLPRWPSWGPRWCPGCARRSVCGPGCPT